MRFFKRDKDGNRFADRAIFAQVWVRKPLPDPGAQNYAFETLDLVAHTPVGAGIGLHDRIVPLAGQLYLLHSAPLVGIPTTAGQIITQPLSNPDLTSPYRVV